MGRWNGGYIRKFSLLPLGAPIAPTVLGVGGRTYSKFGMVIDLSSALTSLFLFSDKSPQFKNMAVRRRLGSKLGPKFGTFSTCKRGQHGSNVCGYFMSTAGGGTVGMVSVGA